VGKEKRKMKRPLLILWILWISFSILFAACTGRETATETDTAPAEETPATAAAQTEEDPLDPSGLLTDRIPQQDFDGYEFVYLAIEQGVNGTTRFVEEMWVEEEEAEPLHEAVWRRNLFLSERLNVRDGVTPVKEPDKVISQAVLGGDDICDLGGPYKGPAMHLAIGGKLRDWNLLDIDYSKAWWNQEAAEKLSAAGYSFLMSGSILVSEIDDTLAMCYNKEIAENYNIEDIYALVREGKWTLDKFMEIAGAVSGDLDGDGWLDVGDDLFGYVQDKHSMNNNWFYSCDLLHDRIDGDGRFEFNVDMERTQEFFDKLAPFLTGDNVYPEIDLYEGLTYFQENKIFIYAIILRNLELLREMKADFGVIPYPMFDEEQGRYITHVGNASPILTVPLTHVGDDGRQAAILEAMAVASLQYMRPAYYQSILKHKLSRDPETAQMLDIIVDSRTYDFSYFLDRGLIGTTRKLLLRGSTDFASTWAAAGDLRSKIQEMVDDMMDAGRAQHEN
jgi:hypothetical protein